MSPSREWVEVQGTCRCEIPLQVSDERRHLVVVLGGKVSLLFFVSIMLDLDLRFQGFHLVPMLLLKNSQLLCKRLVLLLELVFQPCLRKNLENS